MEGPKGRWARIGKRGGLREEAGEPGRKID